MWLLDQAQAAVHKRLADGPWHAVSYECGERVTSKAQVTPSSLGVRPTGTQFEVSDRCDLETELTEMAFEASVEFPCFVSPEAVTDSWRRKALKVFSDSEYHIIYLRSVRIEEGPENGGSTRLTFSFQTLKL